MKHEGSLPSLKFQLRKPALDHRTFLHLSQLDSWRPSSRTMAALKAPQPANWFANKRSGLQDVAGYAGWKMLLQIATRSYRLLRERQFNENYENATKAKLQPPNLELHSKGKSAPTNHSPTITPRNCTKELLGTVPGIVSCGRMSELIHYHPNIIIIHRYSMIWRTQGQQD